MVDQSKKYPGAMFHFESASEVAHGPKEGESQVFGLRVTMYAEYHDQEVGEKLKKKFIEGFYIPTIEDFKEQMIKVLREDGDENARRIKEFELALENERREKDELKQQLNLFQRHRERVR